MKVILLVCGRCRKINDTKGVEIFHYKVILSLNVDFSTF